MHRKSSGSKVTHPSTILALGSLISGSPWEIGEGLGVKPSLEIDLLCIEWRK